MTAIVTGAARGIGAAVADRLSADHAVLRVDIDPSVDGIVADVTKPEDRARIAEAAGEVTVLVNNAGITRDARIGKMTRRRRPAPSSASTSAAPTSSRCAARRSPTARRS